MGWHAKAAEQMMKVPSEAVAAAYCNAVASTAFEADLDSQISIVCRTLMRHKRALKCRAVADLDDNRDWTTIGTTGIEVTICGAGVAGLKQLPRSDVRGQPLSATRLSMRHLISKQSCYT